MTAASGERRNDLLGHPRGLTVLATTEMWERFSFYGMQALLMLYMTKYLLQPEHETTVLGLAAFRSALTVVTGPMTNLAFAAQTFGIYSGLLYGTPLIGAWLGDRVLGKTRAVTIGCLMMAAGHLAMASTHFFLIALVMIVLGAGGVIGNMAAQVGLLYDARDDRRTRAFGVYLITLNIGALAAPLIIGTLGEKIGWHYGFGAAGIGMLIGLVTYLVGHRYLPPDRITKRSGRVQLTRAEWRRVSAILFLLVPYILYSAAAFQAYGIMFVWADTAVNRNVAGWEAPVTWAGVVDGALTILGVMVASRIWIALEKRGRGLGDFTKIAIAYVGVAAAYLLIGASAVMHLVPLLLWIAFFVVLDLSYGWVEPPIASLISRESPRSVNAMMMAMLKASTMISYFLLGWLGRFFEPLGAPLYWTLTGGLSIAALLLMLVFRVPVMRLLEAEPVAEVPTLPASAVA